MRRVLFTLLVNFPGTCFIMSNRIVVFQLMSCASIVRDTAGTARSQRGAVSYPSERITDTKNDLISSMIFL